MDSSMSDRGKGNEPGLDAPALELRAYGRGYVTKPDGTVVHFEFEGKANGNDSDVN
jgi:hypothetical protein